MHESPTRPIVNSTDSQLIKVSASCQMSNCLDKPEAQNTAKQAIFRERCTLMMMTIFSLHL